MSRKYIKLDPRLDERLEAKGYTDGQYRAYVAVLCHAAFQPKRGHFRSLAFLRALLGSRARHVEFLLNQDDIRTYFDADNVERVQVVGWDEWQEGDFTVDDRMARVRRRRQEKALSKHEGLPADNGGRNGGRYGERYGHHARPVTARADTSRVVSTTLDIEHTDTTQHRRAAVTPPTSLSKDFPSSAETDEQMAERYRAIRDDESEPQWKRDAATAWLQATKYEERPE